MGKTRVKKLTIVKPERQLPPSIYIHFLSWGVLLLLVLIANTVVGYWEFRVVRFQKSRLEGLIQQVGQCDQLLTTYARSGVTFGDARSEGNYLETTLQREGVMTQLKEIAPAAFMTSEASAMDAGKAEITDLENQAFDYIREGKLNLADPLVFGAAYEDKEAAYKQDLEKFTAEVRKESAFSYAARGRKVFTAAVAGAASLPLLALWHLFLINKIGRVYQLYVPVPLKA